MPAPFSSFPEPVFGTEGFGLPVLPLGFRTHSSSVGEFPAVNREDGRPGGVHYQSDVPFQASQQLRGDPRRPLHPQVPGRRHCRYRGESNSVKNALDQFDTQLSGTVSGTPF